MATAAASTGETELAWTTACSALPMMDAPLDAMSTTQKNRTARRRSANSDSLSTAEVL